MKKLSIILTIIMLVGLFASCEGIGDSSLEDTEKNKIFEFSYEIEKSEYMRGEEIQIKTYVKNISGRVQKYMGCSGNDYIPWAELYCLNSKGERCGKLNCYPPDMPANVIDKTIKKGEVGSYTYVIKIPDDAVCGSYSIKLSWNGENRVFENVLRITDVTSQNENEKYQYSPITVSTGGKTINPIRVGTSTQIQYADGSFAIGCDGMGVWRYFGNKDTDLSTFPLLVLEDEPLLTLAENTRLEGVCVYGMDAKEIGGHYSSLKALEAFPAGEYVVVIKVVYDTSALSATEYEITSYDDFFRLSIPQKTACKEYDYSPARIRCGGVDVIPIRALLYSSYQSGDQAIEADGLGAAGLFEDKSFSPDDLPALTFTTNVSSYCPAGVTIGKAKVYDLDYNQIDLNMEYMWDFSKLPAGEYIVAFDEKEGRVDATYGYESLFRLIVPESKVKSFSYGAVCQTYKPGDPGVKTEGFKNTSEQSVATTEEAAERAKNECTIEYDTITVLYDANEKTWSVTFSTAVTPGGCQTVYLNNKGITRLIVYGE